MQYDLPVIIQDLIDPSSHDKKNGVTFNSLEIHASITD